MRSLLLFGLSVVAEKTCPGEKEMGGGRVTAPTSCAESSSLTLWNEIANILQARYLHFVGPTPEAFVTATVIRATHAHLHTEHARGDQNRNGGVAGRRSTRCIVPSSQELSKAACNCVGSPHESSGEVQQCTFCVPEYRSMAPREVGF